jgi:hypothetical protein
MLHYNPRQVSSDTVLIFRRSNCITAASGIVTLCKQPYSTPVESGLRVEDYNVTYILLYLFFPLVLHNPQWVCILQPSNGL